MVRTAPVTATVTATPAVLGPLFAEGGFPASHPSSENPLQWQRQVCILLGRRAYKHHL